MLSNTLHQLLQIYADIAAIPVADLTGYAMTPEINKSRNEAVWTINRLNPGPLADLGRVFGGRSVKAIDNALDSVAIRITSDQAYAERLSRVLADMRAALSPVPAMSDSTRLTAAAGVLSDPNLTDADARLAALQLLRPGATPGAATA